MGTGFIGGRGLPEPGRRGDGPRLRRPWITEWYAFSGRVQGALQLRDDERVAGFIYIATATEAPEERARPPLDEIVTAWEA